MDISAPVEEIERSNNFVFAVANENSLSKIGYSSDLDKNLFVESNDPAVLNTRAKTSTHPLRLISSKSKKSNNSASVTFLYK